METKEPLKYIAAELTEREFKGLQELIKTTLQNQHQFLIEMRFMQIPECTCGNCDKDETQKGYKQMLESTERGLETLESLAKKLF